MVKDYKIKNIDIGEANSDPEIIKISRNLLKNKGLGKDTDQCYNYALKNKKLNCVENGVGFIYRHYDMILFKEIRPGDIVLFRDNFDDYLHFARVIKKGNTINNTIIRAKFGGCGIYEHRLCNTPSCYGNRIEFWHNRGDL